MNKTEIKRTVILLIDNFSNKKNKSEETTIDALAFDSLDFVELLIDLEKEFNIHIKDDEFEKVQTIGDIIKLVEKELI